MPKPAAGPRRIDSTGTWYAVKMIKGKRHFISLKTKNRTEAMRLWPAAQAELEALANPVPGDPYAPHFVLDPDTGTGRWEPSPWDPPESPLQGPTGVTWDEAIEVAAKRRQRRSGRPVSDSWRDAIKQGLRYLDKQPEDLTVADVRLMVLRMEERGFKDTTIAQRCAAVSGVLTALIKTGTCPDLLNPFERVDTAASPQEHHTTASPEDYRQIWQGLEGLEVDVAVAIKVMIYSGARISEVLNASYAEGWMQIMQTPTFTPKNRTSKRVIPLPSHITAPLTSRTAGNLRMHFKRIAPEGITPHSLRHGFKTAARIAGADELVVERLLGHTAGSKMSLTYGEYPRELLLREAEKVWRVLDSWVV